MASSKDNHAPWRDPHILVIPVLAGVALGLASWWVDRLPGRGGWESGSILARFGNAPTLWLLLAFATGATARSIPTGAARALLALLAATAAYYGAVLAAEGIGATVVSPPVVTAWVVVAAISAVIFGVAARRWRIGEWAVVSTLLVAGSLAAIGVFEIAEGRDDWPSSRAAMIFGGLHLIAAMAAVLFMPRTTRQRLIAFGLTGMAAVACLVVLRFALGTIQGLV